MAIKDQNDQGSVGVGPTPPVAEPETPPANNFADMPAPRGLYSYASSYVIGELDILSSSDGLGLASYQMQQAAVSADSDGNRIAYEGTVLQKSGAYVVPRTSGAACGVLSRRVNLRDGATEVSVVIRGALREDKCTDNGTFGTVTDAAKSTMLHIQFTDKTDS